MLKILKILSIYSDKNSDPIPPNIYINTGRIYEIIPTCLSGVSENVLCV